MTPVLVDSLIVLAGLVLVSIGLAAYFARWTR